jgi:hypothetical protein
MKLTDVESGDAGYSDPFVVTPSDTEGFSPGFPTVWDAGDVALVFINGQEATITVTEAMVPCRIEYLTKQVMETGTTATVIIIGR